MPAVPDSDKNSDAAKADARWPFVLLYLFMLAGIFGTATNSDPIDLQASIAVLIGLLAVVAIVIYLAVGRVRGHKPFGFQAPTLLGNIPRHIFILTGIIFITFLFFASLIQVLVLAFHAPIFDTSCAKPSERDVALFVWSGMAKGAFKFLASYLHLAPPDCAPSKSGLAEWGSEMGIRIFTSLVLVWYVVGLAKAWYARLKQ